jgi:uncharacterized protein
LILLAAVLQIAVPPPRGYVNDFAGVVDSASAQHVDAVIREVRAKTGGEIAVVTLADIGDRAPGDVALQIGRQWGVGDSGAAGDRRKNLGVVVLLVPRKNHQPGTAHLFIAAGRGAEGFLTDAATGRIEDAMLPTLQQEQYGPALSIGVDFIAQAFAKEFDVTLTNPENVALPPPSSPAGQTPQIPAGWIVIAVILLIIVTRGRIFLVPMLFGGFGRGGGFSIGGGGGFGGFGGFGGGGGFSGGGAGRSF